MDMPQTLFESMINHEYICVIDSGTTHDILKNEKYCSYLLRRKGNVTTISYSLNLIEGFKRTIILLPTGTKLIIADVFFSSKSP